MHRTHQHIMFVAGEASGDMHGAHLVESLKKIDPSLKFSGIGGPLMQKNGVHLYTDLTKIAVVGFIEVLKNYAQFKKAFDMILKKIEETRPAAVILIDYPGFNLRLAPKIKKLGIKVVYYISPQVWAWKAKRVEIVRQHVDKMLVLFPFEKDFYANFGINNVEYVGHPLTETIKVKKSRDEFLTMHKLEPYKTTIALLPGSRRKEISSHLPVMIEAAELLIKKFPMAQFLVARASSIDKATIKKYIPENLKSIRIIDDDTYDAVNASDVCVVASGTATLETALLQKPMVVIYKTSAVTYAIAKSFIKIPYIALVNVVASNRIVPELIQSKATAENISLQVEELIKNETYADQMREDLLRVKRLLGSGGAGRRAAEEILKLI